jgi:hypothetical protein
MSYHAPWRLDEEDFLRKAISVCPEKITKEEIAAYLGRSWDSCRRKAKRMNLVVRETRLSKKSLLESVLEELNID